MSDVDWEGMRPPSWPPPEPPVDERQPWPPITAPGSVAPPPPPPLPPAPPAATAPTSGGGRRLGAVMLSALVLLVVGFSFARITEDGPASGRATPGFPTGSTATVNGDERSVSDFRLLLRQQFVKLVHIGSSRRYERTLREEADC